MDRRCVHRRPGAAMVLRRALALGALLAAGACAELPDLTAFAGATAQMAAGVRAAGPAVAAEVQRVEGGNDIASRLTASWKERDAALDAIVQYADALAAIAGASQDHGDAIAALARSLGELADAAGYPVPGRAAGVATDAARFVWAQVELAGSARLLADALDAAQPVVDRIAETLDADSRDGATVLRAAIENERTNLESDPAYNTAVGARETLGRLKRLEMERLIEAAGGSEADAPAPGTMERLARLDALIASNNAELAPIEARLNGLDARGLAVQRLVEASGDSIRRWAAVHRELAAAVRSRRPVDVGSLVAAVVEIRDLVKKAGAQ